MLSRHLEESYNTLRQSLSKPLAGFKRLVALVEFLEQYAALGAQLDSYRLELTDFLPGLVAETDFECCDPGRLKELYQSLQRHLQISASEPPLAAREATNSIGWAAVRGFERIGHPELGSGLTESLDPVHRNDQRGPAGGVRSVPQFAVRVPVVDFQQTNRFNVGLLSVVECDGFRESPFDEDRIDVSGPFLGPMDFFGDALEAARTLREYPAPVEGQVRLRSTEGLVYGQSCSLAVGLIAACAATASEGARQYLAPAPGVAITGILQADGGVEDVDAASIAPKTQTVFFSSCRRLIVPDSQVDAAIEQVGQLQERYPSRQLAVHGVSTLEDVLADRRFTEVRTVPTLNYLKRRIGRQRQRVAIAVLTLVVTALGLRLSLGPVDGQPARVELAPFGYTIINQFGATIDEIELPAHQVSSLLAGEGAYKKTHLADVDADGEPELFWSEERKPDISLLHFRDYGDRSKDWSIPMTFDIRFPEDPQIQSDHFVVLHMETADIEGDGALELVVNLRHETFYPAVVVLLDPNDGSVKPRNGQPQLFVHSGHFYAMTVADIDDDSLPEVILGGVNQSAAIAALVVLGDEDFWGQGPATGLRLAEARPINEGIGYAEIPQTEVGASFPGEYNHVSNLSWSRATRRLNVEVDDNNRTFKAFPGAEGVRPKVFYTVTPELEIVGGMGTSDQYDTIRRVQEERGVLR